MHARSVTFVAIGAFLLGVAGTWWIVRRDAGSPATPTRGAQTADKAVLYWYDPMVPQQHFDAPGKSPFMDMQLVPKYAAGDNGSDVGVVRIDPRLTQNLGVRTATAERAVLAPTLHATGTLAFDQRAVAVVQSRVAGIVENVWVRAPLSAVKRGEALVTLLAPDWTAAQEEYLSLRRSRAPGLDALRAAARQRLLLLGMDESQIRAVERAGSAQMRITLSAPHDGVISELSVREGATVAPGAALMTLNGLDNIWIDAAIAESDSARVAPGAPITATLAAFPGETFDGRVETLLPDLDAATRTQKARIVLPNPGHRLAPGMFASVELAPPAAAAPVIVIPSEAVIATGTRSVVIVAEGQGKFRPQEVRLGAETGGKTEVRAGIRAGESVVLSGQFLIDSEASLSGTLARLVGQAGAAKPNTAEQADADAPAPKGARP